MTRRDWHTSTDPTAMLRKLVGHITDRKRRQFLIGCCRRHPDLLIDRRMADALDVADQLADGVPGERRRWRAERQATAFYSESMAGIMGGQPAWANGVAALVLECVLPAGRPGRWADTVLDRFIEAVGVHAVLERGGGAAMRELAISDERAAIADIIRCVLGDPFTVTVPDPRWLTDTVTALARRAYDRRDFAVLPILADALEEAGCEDGELLDHCRHGREHARGCWAVDLLLGKS